MKIFFVLLVGVVFFITSTFSISSEKNATEIISCSLPGKVSRKVLFYTNDKKEIIYLFKREGKVELRVLFNESNKLKRFSDDKIGVVYYGFNRGGYSYVIDVITGAEEEEYSVVFDVKKNNKILQSNDCLPGAFVSNDIPNEYITDVIYIDADGFNFP